MRRYLFEQFTAIRLLRTARYSPDGQRIAYIDNTTGQFNLWTMPAGGGYARQLTAFTDNTLREFLWSPDGQTIVFTADENGTEMHQIYRINSAGGWPEALTDAPQAQHSLGDWMPDGKTITFTANDHQPTRMDPQMIDVTTGARKVILEEEGGLHYAGYPAPKGQYVTVNRIYGNTNQDIVLVDLSTGDAQCITPHEGEAVFFVGEWAPDGSGFYFLSNQGREYNNVGFYDLAKGAWDWFYTGEHNVEQIALAQDGSMVLMSINEGGRSQLVARHPKTGADIPMPQLPLGVVESLDIAPDGSKASMTLIRPLEATNLYEIDLQTGAYHALTQSMLGGIDPADMVEPELVHYETFDGKQIPAWFYRPKTGEGPFPALLSIHGGPEAQERPTYSLYYQYLLNRGVAVLAPNIRGSTGYGISYQKLIHRDFGGDDLKDIEHAAKYLQSRADIDGSKMAVFGGSYGGFACLSAVTRLPDYWAAGVDIVGPSNLVTFAKAVPPHWRGFMRNWVGDPEDDFDMLMARSPITYVDNLKAPMLVIQGANDPRVVQAESDQMVERIQANGGEVTYYVDPEEGHGAARRENMNKWLRMCAEFVEAKLLG